MSMANAFDLCVNNKLRNEKSGKADVRAARSEGVDRADFVEKLVGFSLSKWVIALILLGRLYVDHDVSLWRAPTA